MTIIDALFLLFVWIVLPVLLLFFVELSNMFFTYIRWCWTLKEILPWEVSLVSFDDLTEEQYDFPQTLPPHILEEISKYALKK